MSAPDVPSPNAATFTGGGKLPGGGKLRPYGGQKELEDLGKQLEKVVKGFTTADKDQSAGLDQLTPLMQRASELRRLEQGKILDRLFELRETLTPEEWGALLERMR